MVKWARKGKKLRGPNFSHGSGLGVCTKAGDWTIEHQNVVCEQACGNREGQTCRKGCRLWMVEEGKLSSDGARVFPFRELGGIRHDVVVIRQENTITTVLCPVEKTPGESRERLLKRGLSTREIEIVLLLREGHLHQDLCDQLNIRRGTLKTHLKNIRLKMGRRPPF